MLPDNHVAHFVHDQGATQEEGRERVPLARMPAVVVVS
jgi:hypothetical protein